MINNKQFNYNFNNKKKLQTNYDKYESILTKISCFVENLGMLHKSRELSLCLIDLQTSPESAVIQYRNRTVCRAVCRNFANGGANLPYFKKRGHSCKQCQGGTLEDNVVPHST